MQRGPPLPAIVSSVSRCMNARVVGMSIATRQRAAPAAKSRWASTSTACDQEGTVAHQEAVAGWSVPQYLHLEAAAGRSSDRQ